MKTRGVLWALALALALVGSAAVAQPECEKPVYLTIDTGHMGVANLIAEVLKRQNVKATFFAVNEKTKEGDGRSASTGRPGGAIGRLRGTSSPRTPSTTSTGAATARTIR